MNILRIERNTTPLGKSLTVLMTDFSIGFITLDDCFGMDRIRSWAHDKGFEVPK